MEHRVFIAVALSEDLKQKIVDWEQSADLPVRWIIPENLHITLLPPWQETDLKNTIKLFKGLEKLPKVDLACLNISYGPDPQDPRLIWINCEPSPALETIKNQIESIFPSPRENRKYIPHITLARFPHRKQKRLLESPLDVPFSWEEQIKSIQLIESKLLPEGAKYQILETIST